MIRSLTRLTDGVLVKLTLFHDVKQVYRDAFGGLPREVWLLSLVALVNRVGSMVFVFLSLYLTRELGFSKSDAAWLLLCWGLGSVAGSWLGGRLCGQLGALRSQRISLLAGGGMFLAVGRLHGFTALAAGIFLLSLTADTFRPSAMAGVADYAPPAARTRSMALLRLAINLGMTVGPAVGGVLTGIDYRLLFVVDGLTCWAAAGVLAVAMTGRGAMHGTVPVRAGDRAARSVWSDPRFASLMVLVFLLGTVFFQLGSTLPLYFKEAYGLGERAIGTLFAANALLIVTVEMVLIRTLERRNPYRLVGLGCLLVCAGFALMPLGRSYGYALLTVLVWTAGEMLSLPFSNGLVASLGSRDSGPAMGAYTATFGAALIIAPLLGMAVYTRLGPPVLWFGIGALGVLLWVYAQFLAALDRRRAGP